MSAAEVVAAFLRAEYASSRFGGCVRAGLAAARMPAEVVTCPDLSDRRANRARARLLGTCRGWPDRGLFAGLPADVPWALAEMTVRELRRVRLIRCPPWTELTGGSLLAPVALPVGSELRAASDGVLERLLAGDVPPAPILLRGAGELVVLEGNLRVASLLRKPELAPNTLFAYIGAVPDLDRWAFF